MTKEQRFKKNSSSLQQHYMMLTITSVREAFNKDRKSNRKPKEPKMKMNFSESKIRKFRLLNEVSHLSNLTI